MVAQTRADRRIDGELESLRLMLADLPGLLQEWPSLPAAERASWSLDWDQLMGAVHVVLEPAYRSGQMAPAEHLRYEDLRRRLSDAIPLLRRLHLRLPSVPLE